MTKEQVIKKINEIIKKDPRLKATVIKIKFSDKKSQKKS